MSAARVPCPKCGHHYRPTARGNMPAHTRYEPGKDRSVGGTMVRCEGGAADPRVVAQAEYDAHARYVREDVARCVQFVKIARGSLAREIAGYKSARKRLADLAAEYPLAVPGELPPEEP